MWIGCTLTYSVRLGKKTHAQVNQPMNVRTHARQYHNTRTHKRISPSFDFSMKSSNNHHVLAVWFAALGAYQACDADAWFPFIAKPHRQQRQPSMRLRCFFFGFGRLHDSLLARPLRLIACMRFKCTVLQSCFAYLISKTIASTRVYWNVWCVRVLAFIWIPQNPLALYECINRNGWFAL